MRERGGSSSDDGGGDRVGGHSDWHQSDRRDRPFNVHSHLQDEEGEDDLNEAVPEISSNVEEAHSYVPKLADAPWNKKQQEPMNQQTSPPSWDASTPQQAPPPPIPPWNDHKKVFVYLHF